MTESNLPFAVVLDVETEGLEPDKHQLLEVGAIAVDKNWVELARFETVVACAQPGPFTTADVIEMHTKNGLWGACTKLAKESTKDRLWPEQCVEGDLFNWLVSLGFSEKQGAVLAGNGIDFDLSFLKKRMPEAATLLHYRKIDLRSLFLFAENANIGFTPTPKEQYTHRAMGDCEIELADARRLHELLVGLGKRPAGLRKEDGTVVWFDK